MFNSKGEVRDYLFDIRSGNLRPVTLVGMFGGKLSPNASQGAILDIAAQKLVLVDVASDKVSDIAGVEADAQMLVGMLTAAASSYGIRSCPRR